MHCGTAFVIFPFTGLVSLHPLLYCANKPTELGHQLACVGSEATFEQKMFSSLCSCINNNLHR